MNKILFTKVLLLPHSLCVDATNYAPTETSIFFLGNAEANTSTEVSLTFKLFTDAEKKLFVDFYSQVQKDCDGYFLASLPIFGEKRTYLFRFSSTLNHNFLNKTFTEKCLVYCCWSYDESVVDVAVPVITILGNDIVYIDIDDTYTDAGATAYDKKDGDLTGSIVTTGSVNTSILGSNYIKYNATDTAGNRAIEKIRIVIVDEERTYKNVQFVRVTQNGGTKTTGAKAGNNFSGNYMMEIEAIGEDGTNKALNKNCILVSDGSTKSAMTDGNTSTVHDVGYDIDVLKVNLGSIEKIKEIKVFRKWDEGEQFKDSKIEISKDGNSWTTIQDSSVTGRYTETENGTAFTTI